MAVGSVASLAHVHPERRGTDAAARVRASVRASLLQLKGDLAQSHRYGFSSHYNHRGRDL